MYNCSVCQESFENKNVLSNHVRWKHLPKSNFSLFHPKCCCVVCKKDVTIQNLKSHHRKCHEIKPYRGSCLVCNKEVSINSSKFCSRSCGAKYTNSNKDFSKFKSGPPKGFGKKHYSKISWCPICGKPHTKSNTCSNLCKSVLLSNSMKDKIYNGYNPNKNRGRGKQSYLEKSFEEWILKNFDIEYIPEHPIKRLDIKKTYFGDFYFPTKNLIIELDGTHHKKTVEYDKFRDNYIELTYGIKVIRISHSEYTNKSRIQEIINILS